MDVKKDEMVETTSTSAEADLMVTDSTEATPATAGPVETDLMAAAPVAADPAGTNLMVTDTATNNPAETNLTVADPMAVDPAESDSTEEEPAAPKNEGKKRRLWGILELTAAALIFVFSVYLFLNTRGTNLLFVSVTFGRICRYYWIGLLAAMILGLVGWITLKRHVRTVPKMDTKQDK